MGLLASQLGNVVQSSVGDADRSEAGGLLWTSTQLGSALGVAIIGSVVLTGLTNGFADAVVADERVPEAVAVEVVGAVEGGIDFVAADTVAGALDEAGVAADVAGAVVESYENAQLRAGLLGGALLAVLALFATANLPTTVPTHDERV